MVDGFGAFGKLLFLIPNTLYETGSTSYFTEPEYDVDVGAKLFRYQLSKKANPKEKGKARKFAPLSGAALNHRCLHELIEAGFHVVPLSSDYRKLPIEVEVQFIRYEPRRGIQAVGTPPTTHQDNDWAFCVFLLEWENIEGPINAFVPIEHVNKSLEEVPEHKVATAFLVSPLEGYCVEDRKIAHYVGPVRLKQGYEYGRRTIVILSYKPLVPLRPADVNMTIDMLSKKPELLERKPVVADKIRTSASAAGRQSPRQSRAMARKARGVGILAASGAASVAVRSPLEGILLRRGLYA